MYLFFSLIIFFLDIRNNNLIYKFKEKVTHYIYNSIYFPIFYTKIKVENLINFFYKTQNLIKINKKLNEKIILNEVKQLKLDFYKKENLELKKLLNINKLKKNKYIFSKIISYNYIYSKFIINKGEKDNIHIGQPVLNNKGIIGYITSVNKNYSCMFLICNKKCRIPVKILRNGIRFILSGSGINKKLIYKNFNILFNEDIKEGDLLVTSGIDNLYPEGYPVGYISEIKKNNNKYYINIEVKTLFNFHNINYVIILKN